MVAADVVVGDWVAESLAGSVAAANVVAVLELLAPSVGVDDPSPCLAAVAEVGDEPSSGFVVVAATVTAASAGVVAALAGVEEVSSGATVSAATVAAAGALSAAAGVDESAAGVVSLAVEDDDGDEESLAAVLVVDADGSPWRTALVPDAVTTPGAAEVGPAAGCGERFCPGPRTVLRSCRVFRMLAMGPRRRGPGATVLVLAVLAVVAVPLSVLLELVELVELLELVELVESPEAPVLLDPVLSGAAAAMPPLPAKSTPLASTQAPKTALTWVRTTTDSPASSGRSSTIQVLDDTLKRRRVWHYGFTFSTGVKLVTAAAVAVNHPEPEFARSRRAKGPK